MVYLGANACIIGRSMEKTESVAADIATARKGAKVLGIGGCDVRDVCTNNPFIVIYVCCDFAQFVRLLTAM